MNKQKYKTHLIIINDFKNNPKVKILFFQNTKENINYINKVSLILFLIMGLLIVFSLWIINHKMIKYEKSILSIFNSQIKKITEKEDIMIAQSRHAAMGEMISMIAHQWRQPISVISIEASNILVDIELDSLETEDLKECSNEIIAQTQELSKTIDDFRDFFKPQKNTENILLDKVFNNVFDVIGKSLENSNIKTSIKFDNKIKIKTFSRELMQVLINIINNAKDALVENNIKDKKICIFAKDENNKILIRICDNAGGINKDIINKIFEPYFSTKDENIGTGIGLYMSKTIVQKHLHGTIKAYNHGKKNHACFEIVLPYVIDTLKGK